MLDDWPIFSFQVISSATLLDQNTIKTVGPMGGHQDGPAVLWMHAVMQASLAQQCTSQKESKIVVPIGAVTEYNMAKVQQ